MLRNAEVTRMAQVQVWCPGFRSDQIRYSDSDGELEETEIFNLKAKVEFSFRDNTVNHVWFTFHP